MNTEPKGVSTPEPQSPSGPLVGVRVLDLCSFINGSYGASLLGDMGADVIKVESPTGDPCRSWGPFIGGESRLFQAWNRNKRSISLDLRSEEGSQVFRRLVEKTDVLMENFRPGVTKRLGIDWPNMQKLNERLIYCSSSAFGATGPHSSRPGYDPVLQSMGGSAAKQEEMTGTASICSVAVSDYQAAMLCVAGINAALFHRERTGVGQLVQTSLLQAIVSIQSHFYVKPLELEEDGPAGIYPYRMFETREAPLFIAAGTDKFWQMLCEELGVPELGTHPDYKTNPLRVARADELQERITPLFLTKSALEWEEQLVAKGVPCAAVRTCEEFFEHPQVEAMAMRQVVHHPSAGRLQVAGLPIHFDATPGAIQRPAPLLGEHTRQILGEVGVASEQIEALVTAGVARPPTTGP